MVGEHDLARNLVQEALTKTYVAWPRGRDVSQAEAYTLWAELQRRPPRQRAAIVLRYYEDLYEAQTAEVTECAVGTVKSQVSHGLRRLREQLGADAARLLPTEVVVQR